MIKFIRLKNKIITNKIEKKYLIKNRKKTQNKFKRLQSKFMFKKIKKNNYTVTIIANNKTLKLKKK